MSLISGKKAVLFDLDGTLLDTMGIYAAIASDLISEAGILDKETAKIEYFKTSGIPFFKQLEIIASQAPVEIKKKISDIFEKRKIEETRRVKLDSDAHGTLTALKAMGIKTAVSSSNFQKNIDDMFANYPDILELKMGYISDDFTKGAPHVKEAMKIFGVSIKEIIYVGDSPYDAKTASDLGISFAVKLGTFSRKKFLEMFPEYPAVEKLSELL